MNVVVRIPDDLAAHLAADGDVERQALEALAVESYRAGRLTKPELGRMLGFGTRGALDGFLKARDVFEVYTVADIERERHDVERLGF